MINFIQNMVDALSLGSIYALVALGIGLLFGILRLINFAHGDLITIGGYSLIVPSADVTSQMLIGNWSWWTLLPSVCLIVVIVALLTDALVFRPLRRANATTLMIGSFALSYIIQNGLLLVYSSRAKAVDLWPSLNTQIELAAVRLPVLQLTTIGTTLVLMVALIAFLRGTRYGVQMRAAAEDFRMAQYLGVNGNFVIGMAFAVTGILATAVSLLYVTQTGSLSHTMGVPLALFGFVAVVIGGMGSLVGAVVGGFLVGILLVMLQAYLPADLRGFRDAFAFGILVLVLLGRPSGLFPAKNIIERV
ncbi:branched-chain amino acid ABC transporter permease [Rhizobium leguminosarum]|uniref:branched-chain amino acid ABC transporter permease n=1 Tax=Rhizobium leguminosarum TaxID=384 RepID=UPI001C948ED5|nr:branched-chain amino acid ABC transporter permease [Rhizobium leguminosarum]MBY5315369.1 branched-chain amino acid ABC transporter permease [Rhizobium leguminosarum]